MADAPKLRWWWRRHEGTSILTMQRVTWDRVVGLIGEPLEIDVSAMPIGRVAECSSVVASVAHKFGVGTAEVSVFRYDDKDDPWLINQDRYTVWTDLLVHPRLPHMIEAASTQDNANLREFIHENVFLVKQQPGDDHWLKTVPSSITAILRRY